MRLATIAVYLLQLEQSFPIVHYPIVVFIKTMLLTVLALALTAASLLVPVHFRTVDPAVLAPAAANAPSTAERLEQSLNAAHIGPAMRLASASGLEAARIATYPARLSERPAAAVLGGPDASFEGFIELLPRSRYEAGVPQPIIPLLLPSSDRRLLAERLAASTNNNVQALLAIRQLRGMLRLHPADHPAGAPYDAGVLALAQLIESDHIDPAWGDQIGDLANQAAAGNTQAIAAVESFIMATLSMGRQLDFRSLANLASENRSLASWTDKATLFRAKPGQIDTLYTALHYEATSDRLFSFIEAFPESGMADLSHAILAGPGAVDHLLGEQLPLHQPTPLTRSLMVPLESFRPVIFVGLAAEQREAALALKLLLLLSGGLAMALALGVIWRAGSTQGNTPGRLAPAVLVRNGSFSLAYALILWFAFEPDVLQSDSSDVEAGPRLEFAMASAVDAIKSPVKTMQELNEVTLLVLALFFVLQLVIYCFCLIKLKEIARQSLEPAMKIRLLDNEENLFDFGLYVGLGGTVLSLILVAIGIVEASLMAAYASTLFGILFVALLKVLHLRPYRRRLILQAGDDQAGSRTLQKDRL